MFSKGPVCPEQINSLALEWGRSTIFGVRSSVLNTPWFLVRNLSKNTLAKRLLYPALSGERTKIFTFWPKKVLQFKLVKWIRECGLWFCPTLLSIRRSNFDSSCISCTSVWVRGEKAAWCFQTYWMQTLSIQRKYCSNVLFGQTFPLEEPIKPFCLKEFPTM